MTYNQWITAYQKITSKLNKKTPLTTVEIDELLDIIENLKGFVADSEYEVIKRL